MKFRLTVTLQIDRNACFNEMHHNHWCWFVEIGMIDRGSKWIIFDGYVIHRRRSKGLRVKINCSLFAFRKIFQINMTSTYDVIMSWKILSEQYTTLQILIIWKQDLGWSLITRLAWIMEGCRGTYFLWWSVRSFYRGWYDFHSLL